MSPEQAAGRSQAVDARADVYAIGTMLFELVAGRLPLATRDAPVHETLRAIIERDPDPLRGVPGVDRDLDTIVGRALEKDPARRFRDAGELGAELRR
jgi:serine/threonine protein kinase